MEINKLLILFGLLQLLV